MALAIVPGSEVETPNASPKVDGGVFRSAILSKGRSAAEAGDAIGGFFDDVSQKFQQNRNARTLLDADLQMRQFSDTYRDSLAKNPNEDEWAANFEEQSNQLKDHLLDGPGVGPDVKRQLQANLDRWQGATQGEITTAAQLQSLNRTKQTAIADYTYAARQGDVDGAMNAIQHGQENHALFPEDADRMRREVPRIAEQAQVDTGIENNPQLTYQKLTATTKTGNPSNFKSLDPNSRLRLTSQALQRWHAEQSASADGIRDDIDSGKIPEEADIKAKEDSGQISGKAASSLRRYVKQKDWAESRANAAELMSDASSYDPTSDKDGKQFRDIQDQAVGLPQKYKDRVTRTLQERVKNSDKSDDGMKTIDRLYDSKTFGDWKNADGKIDPKLWKKANDARWDMQDSLSTWRQKNPQATHKDEREFIMGQAQRHFDQQSTQAVINGFSGSTQ